MANVWSKFKRLTEKSTFFIAEVISVGSDTSVVEDLNGQQYTVIGTGITVGNRCFIKDGIIQSEAPALTLTADVIV